MFTKKAIMHITEGENKMADEKKTPAANTGTNRIYAAESIDLLDLLKSVFRFWPLLILGAMIGAVIMGGSRYVKKYTYTSSSKLYVLSTSTSITNLADLQLGSTLSDDFVEMIKSKPVLDKSIKDVESSMGVTLTRSQVLGALSVSHTSDTRIITISCTTQDAELSKELCDAVTTRTAQRMSEITQTDAPTLVESAEVASSPNSKGISAAAQKGALGGFAIVFILLCIPYLLNDKIKGADDVNKYLGEVVIGVVPYEKSLFFKSKRKKKKLLNEKEAK